LQSPPKLATPKFANVENILIIWLNLLRLVDSQKKSATELVFQQTQEYEERQEQEVLI
jgi:hypothetical protein